ncbi:MAG: FliO/MopB family protein [Lautropia sp.]
MDSFALNFAGTMLALAAVVAIAWFALRLARDRLQPRVRPGDRAGDDALRFVRALPVGTRERVVIVEHRGARWMLGVTAGGIQTIAHWPAATPAARPDGADAIGAAQGDDTARPASR